MKNLQQKHKEWSDRNFKDNQPKTSYRDLGNIIDVAVHVGGMAHHTLKAFQGIRGDVDMHYLGMLKSAHRTVDEIGRFGFGFGDPSNFKALDSQALVGVIEEVGELAAACSHEERFDAVGDIVLYLLDYCNHVGIDFEDAVRTTAEKVHKRDWVANPVNGEVE